MACAAPGSEVLRLEGHDLGCALKLFADSKLAGREEQLDDGINRSRRLRLLALLLPRRASGSTQRLCSWRGLPTSRRADVRGLGRLDLVGLMAAIPQISIYPSARGIMLVLACQC